MTFARTITQLLGLGSGREFADLNRRLKGYPRNHNYAIRHGGRGAGDHRLVPSRRLQERYEALSGLLPSPVGSFLDVGSCKGYFVFQASHVAGCPLAVGIDVHKPFVDLSNDIAQRLHLTAVRFHHMGLEEAAKDPDVLGGPFDTVQLVSAYHYFYWGSELEKQAYRSHPAILDMLARCLVIGGHIVFANPLEVADSPDFIQQRAAAEKDLAKDYTTAGFLKAAERLFTVEQRGFMDRGRKRPMLVLTRRG